MAEKPAASSPKAPVDMGSWTDTSNAFGYHCTVISTFEEAFIARIGAAAESTSGAVRVADLGCGAGYTTAALLRGTPGNVHVTAADLSDEHMEEVLAKIPEPALRMRLTTVAADVTTALHFPANSLRAILACRWMHFLTGSQFRAFVHKAAGWLEPGGLLAITCESPYMSSMTTTFQPIFEARVEAAEEWPGIRPMPATTLFTNVPPFLHFMTPPILRREAELAGLEVLDCTFLARPYYPAALRMDGRESAVLLARKLLAAPAAEQR